MKYFLKYASLLFILTLIGVLYIILGRHGSISLNESIIISIRLPRLILAIMTGAVLASTGALMQGLLRNPLADPYLLGISGGAVLGHSLSYIIFPGNLIFAIIMSFAGGFTAFASTIFLAQLWKGNREYSMIISGIMISTFSSSAVALIFIFSQRNISEYFYTIMGSLNIIFLRDYMLIYMLLLGIIAVVMILLVLKSRELDIVSAGYEVGLTSGINVKRTMYLTLILSAFAVSVVVAFAGIIGFVGIVVPHLVRKITDARHFHIFLMSLLLGSILLTGADFIVKNIFVQEIPVGILTSLLGIPIFIYILRRVR